MLITPTLIFGGLLNGRAPIDLGEADKSQSGKGYRNKLVGAIHNTTPKIIAQRAKGGVGSIQESFDAALVAGASFISIDNFRGKLDLPGIESFLTEDQYFARVPYAAPVAIDPRRIIVLFTSNAAEVTDDMSNRSAVVRILKHDDGHEFAQYGDSDLLDHVRANQPRYLGAVFAVIREWHRRGKPQLPSAGHDFRPWAKVLGYISEHVLQAGALLDGHRGAQQRIASPGLGWLREVALAVVRNDQAGQWLRTNHLLQIVIDANIETAGVEATELDDEAAWLKATQGIGRKLGHLFNGSDEIAVDNVLIERREVTDEHFRPRKEYVFFPQTPNRPE